ncbi:MAG: aldehyde dehydrogenase family protein [Acidobacteriota bacterium]
MTIVHVATPDAPPRAADAPRLDPTFADHRVPPDSSHEELDTSLRDLRTAAADWAVLPLDDRRAILRELIKDFHGVADRWAEACRRAEHLPRRGAGEKYLSGPYLVLRNLRLLEESLEQIDRFGSPRPNATYARLDGRVVAEVFPQTAYDRTFFPGLSAQVWMRRGVELDSLPLTQAVAYRESAKEGRVALVLGAGNVSSIGPMDVLYKLFVENTVVLLKMHPVNAFLGPLLAEGFQALLDWRGLRLAYGDVEVGAYLCEHDEVDEIHITGSDRTVEAIVYGTGAEGARRKREGRPKNRRPISSELGNVSPVLVVPGPWSGGDLDYQGENIASMLVNNAGFNCNAARVIVQHADWPKRQRLLDAVRAHLAATPARFAYYPGAEERHAAFQAAHPEAEHHGEAAEGELPWTLIPGVDPEARDDESEIAFRQEAFCSVLAETTLEAPTVVEYIERAVEFCNRRLWGTLNVSLLVHPRSLLDRRVAAAVEQAIADLRYGTVAVNCWPAVGYGLVTTTWGAYPGHTLDDIQSGTGVVHNTLMFDQAEKSVVRAPFRMTPKPPWFPSHQHTLELARRLTDFEAAPSSAKLPGIVWAALRG